MEDTIRHDATTIWERWDGWTEEKGFQSPRMNSFNHCSLGPVGERLYRYVASIAPDPRSPGYKHPVMHLRPRGRSAWARGVYDPISGKTASYWNTDDGKFDLKVIIPAKATAPVYLPVTEESQITEGGTNRWSKQKAPSSSMWKQEKPYWELSSGGTTGLFVAREPLMPVNAILPLGRGNG